MTKPDTGLRFNGETSFLAIPLPSSSEGDDNEERGFFVELQLVPDVAEKARGRQLLAFVGTNGYDKAKHGDYVALAVDEGNVPGEIKVGIL